MKRWTALGLVLLVLTLLVACTHPQPLPTDQVTLQGLLTSPEVETTTEYVPREEDVLLGVWSNRNGMTMEFTRTEGGQYRYELRAENLLSAPSSGAYSVKDGVLRIDGYADTEEIEFSLEADKLIIELKGSSFTLTRQEA